MEKNLDWVFEKFIAHKGFWDENNPENSLGAFTRAIEHNYSIELDVRMLEDDTLVVFHDKELSRMTGEDGYISKLTAADLSHYRLQNSEYCIPTLAQALEHIAGKVPVIIDLKSDATHVGGIEGKLADILSGYAGEVAVMSFNPLSLEWFAKNAPSITRGLLSTRWTKDLHDRPDTFLKRFATAHNLLSKRAKPDFLAYNIKQLPSIKTHKFKKIPLLGWTVSSQEEYLDKVKYVDNIIFEGFEPKI